MKYIYITDFFEADPLYPDKILDVMLIPFDGEFVKLTPEIVADDFRTRNDPFGRCYWLESPDYQGKRYIPQFIDKEGERNMINNLKAMKRAMKRAAEMGVRQ